MNVDFGKDRFEFRPWRPAMGGVFTKTFAFDCETTLIDDVRPWLAPAYVIGAAFDSKQGYFVRRADVAGFFAAHDNVSVAFHYAAFDLAVIDKLAPQIAIYGKVDKHQVWDTQLLHRLYVLGTSGHTAGGKGESDLEHCAERYLKVRLPKDVTDSRGNLVRLSYGRWLTTPPQEIEPIYLEYLAKDAIATRLVYRALRKRLKVLLADSRRVWGFVSPEWLDEQIRSWGPQTHHIQLGASIVLKEITANGLHLDLARKDDLAEGLKAKLAQFKKSLRRFGHLPDGKGANKSLQSVLRRAEQRCRGVRFPRTGTGLYATSHDALQDLVDTVPFVRVLLEYRETDKLLGSFVTKMGQRVLHPSFNVLVRSGRTSSFGEINAQNLPKDKRVRSCFVPSHGNVFIDCDYKTIELATLAQACVGQFGLKSKMAEAINAGKDLHTMVAARVKNKTEAEVTKDERTKAKPINFGKPGGMGDVTMKVYAKVSYGIRLSEVEVKALSDGWFDLFPEMRKFLWDDINIPLELAKLLDLTLASHFEHTDDARFARHPENAGREHRANSVLGAMCLKALKTDSPQTDAGKPYSAADLDYFWSRLESKVSSFAPSFHDDIVQRRPSVRLQREVMSRVGSAGCFTFSGRLRAKATYSARHNTVFQGLAADGAKLALWLLWRAGYRIVNFIHDQVLIEVPRGSDLNQHAERIRELMVQGMRLVVPNVKVDVSFAAADRWYKDAEAVYDATGKRLLVYKPKPARHKRLARV